MAPVPGWPGFAAKPGSVTTTTIFVMTPVIWLPCLVIELETAVPMYAGTDASGDELLPGDDVQMAAQEGGLDPGLSAKPLKEAGAPPPVRAFCPAHCAPQNVTFEGFAVTVVSPRTKIPRLGNAKTIALCEASLDGK